MRHLRADPSSTQVLLMSAALGRIPSGAKFTQAAAFNYFVYTIGHAALASHEERNTAL